MTADRDVLLAHYRSLLTKLEAARLATNVERRQIGEQFKVIDGARPLAGLEAGILASMASYFWRHRYPVAH